MTISRAMSKEIKLAILSVLENHEEDMPGAAMSTADLRQKVWSHLGIDPWTLGTNTSGQSVASTTVSTKLFHLKKGGKVTSPHRGWYQIAPVVVHPPRSEWEVPALDSEKVEPETVEVEVEKVEAWRSKPTIREMVQAKNEAVEVEAVEVEAIGVEAIGVNFDEADLGLDDMPEWYSDEYLLALAVKSMRCFGSWDGDNATCKKCPLRRECLKALVRRAEEMVAASKEEEDAKIAARFLAAQAPKAPKVKRGIKAAKKVAKSFSKGWPPKGLTRIVASSKTTCPNTGQIIMPGEPAWYAPGTGLIYHASEHVGGPTNG